MTAEPTTRYYAPQVRVVDAGAAPVDGQEVLIGATPIVDEHGADTGQVHLDVVSASVTLVASGIGQLTLVLNNQRFTADGRPRTPPWKYNRLDLVKFGQKLRVDMTYGAQPWTKMILVQVNNVKFSFPAGGPAVVTVIGEDYGCLFNRKPREDVGYPRGADEAQIVADVVARAGAGASVPAFAGTTVARAERDDAGWMEYRGSRIAWPVFGDALEHQTHSKTQTYWQFLQSFLERLDFELFVDFARNYLPADETGEARPAPAPDAPPAPAEDPSPNEVLLHFEPARSLLGGAAPGFAVDLEWGGNLLDFTPTVKLWDLFTSFDTSGRQPARLARVYDIVDSDSEIDAILAEDLGPDLMPITAVRRDQLRDVTTPTESNLSDTFTNLDRDRARLKAKAMVRAKAREGVTAEATVIGFPTLRPGCHVDITGLEAPFDGVYYVTKAVHTLDSGGYKTQLSLRRPGLRDPARYPA